MFTKSIPFTDKRTWLHIDKEIELQRMAAKYGFAPYIHEVKKFPDRYELVMDKIDALCLADQYGDDPKNFFMLSSEVSKLYPKKDLGKDIPWGALGMYTYFHDRIGVGLKQMMAGSRKFKLECIDREDIASLSPYARHVTGIETLDEMALRVMPGILEHFD